MEKPRGDFNNEAIYISELITELQKLFNEYGDLPVFSGVDYSWVSYAEVENDNVFMNYHGKYVRLEA